MTRDAFGNYGDVPTIGRVTPVTNKDQIIPGDLWQPHYTDRRFLDNTRDGLTIFVDPLTVLVHGDFVDQIGEGLTYSYSDRVQQHVGHEAIDEAAKRAAEEVGNNRSARFVEHMLRYAFQDERLWLGHMRAGVNRSNGYPYHIYGFRSGNQTK